MVIFSGIYIHTNGKSILEITGIAIVSAIMPFIVSYLEKRWWKWAKRDSNATEDS
jgi:hypothetical protein